MRTKRPNSGPAFANRSSAAWTSDGVVVTPKSGAFAGTPPNASAPGGRGGRRIVILRADPCSSSPAGVMRTESSPCANRSEPKTARAPSTSIRRWARSAPSGRARAAADAPNAWAATEADGPSVAHFPSGENHAHSVRPACGPGGTRSVPCASGTASGCRCRKASRASDVG